MKIGLGIGVSFPKIPLTEVDLLVADYGLNDEPDIAAFDFKSLTGRIKDTTTAANNWAGSVSDKLSYTSPSTKWIRNSSGVYVSGTTIRCDHDKNGSRLGALIEQARTNILLNSSDITAGGSATRATPAHGVATGPDGLTSLDSLVFDNTASSTHLKTYASIAFSNATLYEHNIVVKKLNNCQFIHVGFPAAVFGAAVRYSYDLDSGTTNRITAGTNDAAEMVEILPGYWLCSMRATSTAAASGPVTLYISTSGATASCNGDGVSGVYIWHRQITAGDFYTSPIKTSGSSATRNADNISVALSALPFSATAGTLVAGISSVRLSAAASYGRIMSINDGTADNAVDFYPTSSTQGAGIVTAATVAQTAFTGTNISQTSKSAIAWATDDIAYCVDGGTVQTDSGATIPTGLTTMNFGHQANGGHLSGHLSFAIYIPRRLSNAELQSITT